MTDISISTIETERGRMTSFRVGERTAYLLGTTALTGHRMIGGLVQALNDGVASMGELVEARAADLTTAGRIKLAAETISARVKAHFNALRRAIPDAEADLAKRRDDFRKPFFTDDQPPAVRVELRQHARSLPLPALMEAVQSDQALAAAIVEGGVAMSGLPADIYGRVARDMEVGNAARVLSGQRVYRTAPTAADPVGGRLDPDAARAAGEALIAALEAEQALLDSAPSVLAAAVDIAAILTDATRDDALTLLT